MNFKFLIVILLVSATVSVFAERTNQSAKVLDPGDWDVSAGWSLSFNPLEGGDVVDNGFGVSISKYKGNDTSVTIPSGFYVEMRYRIDYSGPYHVETNYYQATLGWHVFSENTIINSVNLGSHSKISYGCFSGCSALTEVIGAPTEIEDSAFENCTSLTSFPFCNLTNSVCNLTNSVINLSTFFWFIYPPRNILRYPMRFFCLRNLRSQRQRRLCPCKLLRTQSRKQGNGEYRYGHRASGDSHKFR